ncbi:MAG: hypothetical protein LC792_19875 [Actinobacteria bacterium]|nr:hypothetical protein [Actinomycetota bacterium]
MTSAKIAAAHVVLLLWRSGRRSVAVAIAGLLLVGPAAASARKETGGSGDRARTTALASVASDGTPGDGASFSPTLSRDATTVAFASFAATLVPDGRPQVLGIFVRDGTAGRTTLVSRRSDGTPADGDSSNPSISGDGRDVAFESSATNLVAGDTNDEPDVFVHDRQTGRTRRISVASDGSQGDGGSFRPSISGDGRFVAFESDATGLAAGDHNGAKDVYVHDRQTGRTQRISVASDGTEGDGDSSSPSISSDGRFVAFVSSATNLVAGDTNDATDVFVHDRWTGRTRRVSVASDGTEGDGSSMSPSISGDGTTVAFNSLSTNLVAGDTNDAADVFAYDRETGRTTRVSTASDGSQAERGGSSPTVSGNGRMVAFLTDGALTPDDVNHGQDIYVHDRKGNTTTRVSVGADRVDANGRGVTPSISGDGTVVAFASLATNLVDGDDNATEDVFWSRPAERAPPPSEERTERHLPRRRSHSVTTG